MTKPKSFLSNAVSVGIVVFLGLMHFSHAVEPGEGKAKPVFTVSEYDSKRDPTKDLAETVKLAQKEKRRIILLVGGNWCPWCRMIPKYFEDTAPVAAILSRDYVIMKVNDSDENDNANFLGQYPEFPAYPHLIVLDSNGKHLHSQDSEELEKGNGYDDDAFVAFLKKWASK